MAFSISPATNPISTNQLPGSGNESRKDLALLIGRITAVLLGIVTAALVYYSINHPTWQNIVLTGSQTVSWLIACGSLLRIVKHSHVRVYLLITSILVMMAGFSILISGQAITSALIALAYTLIITSVSMSGTSAERGLIPGIGVAWAICLVGLMNPFEKGTLPGIQYISPAIIGLLVILYIALLALRYGSATLRLKLILGSMLLVIIPLLAVSLVQAAIVQNTILAQIKETLSSAADQTAYRVDNILISNRDAIASDATIPVLSKYLALAPDKRPGSPEENNLWVTFDALKKRTQAYLISYGLLDTQGKVVYDINPAEIGQDEANTTSFSNAQLGGQYISNIEFSETDGKPYLYYSSPVFDENRVLLGVIRVKYDADIFQSILKENTNIIGPNTYPILVDENLMRLGDTRNPQYQYKFLATPSDTKAALLKSTRRIPQNADFATSTNLVDLSTALSANSMQSFLTTSFDPGSSTNTDQEFVAVTQLKNKPWLVLYIQPASSLSDLAATQEKSTTLITVLLTGLVALLTTLFASAFTQPISKLTETAQKISQGDLTVTAETSNDEIGMLANAFNFMTGRLRKFIADLENQVSLRTSELANRNDALIIRDRQIQTIAEVARTIATSQDVETLLDQVSELISSRFNFYHTGIFLIDENREFAVLRASNSEGGKRMLARRHMLRIGQAGMVGNVCESGKARIATDVGNDAVFFNNPDLPRTRSEMAIPLLGGGQIIGALDVQSIQPNAFTQDNVELFTTLADQIAIAILNSQALEETQRALVEAQLVHRQYLQQEWNRELSEKEHHAYEFTPQGLVIRDRVESEDISSVFSTGEMVLRNSDQNHLDQEPAVLGMPIKLRGETIGIIHLQDESDTAREWTNEDIQIVQTIADQVAQAIENARLFQQTVSRADRERKVIEISSKIRSTNDPEIMLKIAVEELQLALHASKTQVILNQNFEKPDIDKGPSNGSGFPGRSNGNEKSKLA